MANPKMQRAHFQLIADTIKEGLSVEGLSHGQYEVLRKQALAFARSLRATNPNFNRDRFLAACGVEE